MKDYYETLGVSKDASAEDIKSAYKKLAKKFHPDINKDPKATEKFKEINEAASVLLDENKKANYDKFGSADPQAQGFSGFDFNSDDGFDVNDIFESFFGGGGQKRKRRPSRGSDIHMDMEIDLEEAFSGKKEEVVVSRYETCTECEGSGAKNAASIKDCNECNGHGYIKVVRRTLFGAVQTTATCEKCNGEGKYIKDPCKGCSGHGRVKKQRRIEIETPAGIEDNMKLRVSGEGEAGAKNSGPGDLYLVLRIRKHELFERRGSDLYCEVPISFTQAAFGAEIKVPTIDGSAMLKIPQGTQTHTVLRMKQKGMPDIHDRGTGDQLVKVIIQTPKNLSRKQREILEQFEKESGDDGNPIKSFFEKFKKNF